MGGRIHGFLGGVLLTSALTYYTGEYFHKKQQFISHHLRTSNDIINERILSNKPRDELVAIDKSITYTSRQGVSEIAKDIWNEEVIKMVNWLYSINWYNIVVTTDKKISQLTDKVAQSVVEKSK